MNTKKRGRPRKIAEKEVKQPFEYVEQVAISPEVMHLRCIKQFPNPRFVGCDLNGELLKVMISPRYTNKLVGKTIKVAKVTRDLLEEYEYLP